MPGSPQRFGEYSPDEILGPLNDVERRFAPDRLYTAGDVSIVRERVAVAVVGSRRPSVEGRKRAERLVRMLVEREAAVVSGLAEGIDTVAHETAIHAGGKTIAVLGTALSASYPRSNRSLQARIMKEHLAISQFGLDVPVQRKNFPQRNRTMALIADASVIVEAGNSSGTLSQGWEALRLGRPLLILRALVENPALDWPRKMLDYGALVLAEAEDLFSALPAERRPHNLHAAF